MTLSFRARLALQWNVAFSLLLAAASVAIYVGIRAFLLNDLDADLRTLAATELASASDAPEGAHLHEFTPDPADSDYNLKFVQLIGRDGHLLMQTPGLRADRPLVAGQDMVNAFAGRAPVLVVRVDDRPGRMIALRTNGPDPYLVAVGIFTDRVNATLTWVRQLLLAVWVVAILLTGAIGHTLASNALKPIRRITSRAAEIAQGRFAMRLDPPAVDDEIGRMTRLLNQMLERMFHAIEANRRFAADASHELRSPLTAMLGEVDVALKRERTPEEYRETLRMARQRLQQMAGLTDDLMLLVRAQEGKSGAVAEVPLASMLERVASRVADAAAARQIAVHVDIAGDLVAYGEERLLERVFDNLVRNAVQYNVDGGSVDITARLHPREGAWVSDEVIVSVRDTGPGIPDAEKERIFERFHRLDPSRSRRTGGAGLGLAIAREIVTLFNGTLRVAETAGPGATFEVRLAGGRPA
jgi:two-component system OmpR family sensor kinase